MKKIVMTVIIVGLGFAGLQSKHYHVNGKPVPLDEKLFKATIDNYQKELDNYQKDLNNFNSNYLAYAEIISNNEEINNYGKDDMKNCSSCLGDESLISVDYSSNNGPCVCYKKTHKTFGGNKHSYTYVPFKKDALTNYQAVKKLQEKNSELKKNIFPFTGPFTFNDLCDVACKGLGDPGHNIYDSNNNTCACRVK